MKILQKVIKSFDIPIGTRLRVSIWLIPLLVFSVHGGYIKYLLVAYACAALHELSHVLCAVLLKVGISKIHIYPFGISAQLSADYIRSSEKEFLIAFAGPLCSLVLFWIISFLNTFLNHELLIYASDCNLALCAVNLIPALPLDGGRMLKSILTSRYGILRTYNLMFKISRIAVFVLAVFAAIFLLIQPFNFSLVLISAFLFQNLGFEQRTLITTNLKEVLYAGEKIKKDKLLRTKALCVNEDLLVIRVLQFLSYDCFYIIHILDRSSKVRKTMTETEAIEALTKMGVRIRFKDV